MPVVATLHHPKREELVKPGTGSSYRDIGQNRVFPPICSYLLYRDLPPSPPVLQDRSVAVAVDFAGLGSVDPIASFGMHLVAVLKVTVGLGIGIPAPDASGQID